MAFHKAERRKAKLRLGITGPAGSGKTYGALLVGMGLGGKIAMIDTENGSGDLYSGLGDYDVCTIEAPYTVQKYLTAIEEAEKAGYDVLIIDSLSHAWAGEGGLLDMQGKIADSSRSGNSYTAWRQVTPLHNKLVEAMLASKCHVIATMRSKTEYVQEKGDNGKTIIRKVGLAPVQRDGMDYEFGTVFDLGLNHAATVSKDRTSLFDGDVFTLSKETGEKLKAWLESGAAGSINIEQKEALWHRYLAVCGNNRQHAINAMSKAVGGKPAAGWNADDIPTFEADLTRREAELMQSSTTFDEPIEAEPVDMAEPDHIVEADEDK